MPPTESTSLLPLDKETNDNGTTTTPAKSSSSAMSTWFVILQVLLLVFFGVGTTYSSEEYKVKE